MILETLPDAEEFYKNYWGKKPFIVRNYIPTEVIKNFIDGDSLAGLSLEEEIKSRIVTNNLSGDEWKCEHGPFHENRFNEIGDKDWSLLVQNVEQYHAGTAKLLSYFHFSPRWLLDDIMVSFSAPGGSVGPHTDSYHTFLVQGTGKRTWRISTEKINDDRYADNADMKILQQGFDGEIFEVTAGDIIYMPPFFGHEGKTLEAAMTFSVGFLGPKTSEMLSDYAQYLEENEEINKRFLAESLNTDSSSFNISSRTQKAIKDDIISSLQTEHFAKWLTAYFSTPTHEEIEEITAPEDLDLITTLKNGGKLFRSEAIKLTITQSLNGSFNLAIYGEVLIASAEQAVLIQTLNDGQDITYDTLEKYENKDETINLITALYQQQVLVLSPGNV